MDKKVITFTSLFIDIIIGLKICVGFSLTDRNPFALCHTDILPPCRLKLSKEIFQIWSNIEDPAPWHVDSMGIRAEAQRVIDSNPAIHVRSIICNIRLKTQKNGVSLACKLVRVLNQGRQGR